MCVSETVSECLNVVVMLTTYVYICQPVSKTNYTIFLDLKTRISNRIAMGKTFANFWRNGPNCMTQFIWLKYIYLKDYSNETSALCVSAITLKLFNRKWLCNLTKLHVILNICTYTGFLQSQITCSRCNHSSEWIYVG